MQFLVACCLMLATTWQVSVFAADNLPDTTVPAHAGNACVEPIDVMRREHMQLLMHQRDRTVHQAFRGKRHSLNACVRCHVRLDSHGQTVAVNAPGQFCADCHAYAAVQMDCFECHATTPDSGRRAGAARQ